MSIDVHLVANICRVFMTVVFVALALMTVFIWVDTEKQENFTEKIPHYTGLRLYYVGILASVICAIVGMWG